MHIELSPSSFSCFDFDIIKLLPVKLVRKSVRASDINTWKHRSIEIVGVQRIVGLNNPVSRNEIRLNFYWRSDNWYGSRFASELNCD
jgi:hypothetical protein